MSGSSLDGLDIAHVQLEEVRGAWSYQLLHTSCVPYSETWLGRLKSASNTTVPDFLKLHTAYGNYLGEQVNDFIARNGLAHQVHFIASHGHTVFHDPSAKTTFQMGDGAALAATTGLPVISDLRSVDVAYGGQGAPIVPIADKLLFPGSDYLLNIGGIANMTVRQNDSYIAFDVCPANQILNALAVGEGKDMDEGGAMAAAGTLLPDVLDALSAEPYYALPAPKSLSNEAAMQLAYPKLTSSPYATNDLLNTMVVHIATEVAKAVKQYPHQSEQATMLVTGGGAFNNYLIGQIEQVLRPLRVSVNVPPAEVVKFKEAVAMALIGTLRWREEVNTLSTVTGAKQDSCGGALWMP